MLGDGTIAKPAKVLIPFSLNKLVFIAMYAPGTDSKNQISFHNSVHSCLVTQISKGSAPKGMRGGESVIMKIRRTHWGLKVLGQSLDLGDPLPHHDSAPGQDDRILRVPDQFRCVHYGLWTSG